MPPNFYLIYSKIQKSVIQSTVPQITVTGITDEILWKRSGKSRAKQALVTSQ